MNTISIYFNIFKVPLPATVTITLLWRGWRKGDAENTRDIVAILHCTMYSYIYGMRTVFSFPFVGTSSCKCWCWQRSGAICVPYVGGRASHPQVAICTIILMSFLVHFLEAHGLL